MNVRQLKERLEQYPDHLEVFVGERVTEFTYGMVNSVYSKEIDFRDGDPQAEILASYEVLIIDEE